MALTDRQRRYAALIAAGRTPLEAMAAAGYRVKCRRWLARNQADARIAALVTRLRAGWADDAPAAVSKHGITRMLAADRRLAYREGAPGAAVAASVAIARINGWIADPRHPAPKPLAEMGDAELQRYLLALEPPGEGAEAGAEAGAGTGAGDAHGNVGRAEDVGGPAEAAQGPEAAPRPAAADAAEPDGRGCRPGVDDAEPAATGGGAGPGRSPGHRGKRGRRRRRSGQGRRGGGKGGGRG